MIDFTEFTKTNGQFQKYTKGPVSFLICFITWIMSSIIHSDLRSICHKMLWDYRNTVSFRSFRMYIFPSESKAPYPPELQQPSNEQEGPNGKSQALSSPTLKERLCAWPLWDFSQPTRADPRSSAGSPVPPLHPALHTLSGWKTVI